MALPGQERLLRRLLRRPVNGPRFLWACLGLALGGTVSAAFPITAALVPAALMAPGRWRQITCAMALGSAIGATLIVFASRHLGWAPLYDQFPEIPSHPGWTRVMLWAAQYGVLALFVVAISPLPQTPILIFFGVAHHDYVSIFAAMLAGKLVKYGTSGGRLCALR